MQDISDELIVNNYTESYFQYINQFAVLPKSKLIELFKNKDYETIFYHNLRLVPYIAKKYYKNKGTLTLMDLIQEGNIGLNEAIRHYDYTLDNAFSTYATFWIKQKISQLMANQSKSISYSYDMYFKQLKIKKANDIIQKSLGRAPTKEEIALNTNLSLKQIEDANKHKIDTTSINDLEFYFKDNQNNEEIILDNILLKTIIQDAKLTKLELDVINYYYFLNINIKDIANYNNCSRQNIESLLKKALEKLKNAFNNINNTKINNLNRINILDFFYYLKICSIKRNINFFKNFSNNLINRLFRYSCLNNKEKQVLILLLGINKNCILSYDEISKKLNYSYDEVKRISKEAFNKIADLIKLLYPEVSLKKVRKINCN